MSTFTFGFVISQLEELNRTDLQDPHIKKLCIKVYARPELHKDLEATVKLELHYNYALICPAFYHSKFMKELKSRCCRYNPISELIFH